jgi:hypothetical protein
MANSRRTVVDEFLDLIMKDGVIYKSTLKAIDTNR